MTPRSLSIKKSDSQRIAKYETNKSYKTRSSKKAATYLNDQPDSIAEEYMDQPLPPSQSTGKSCSSRNSKETKETEA